MATDGNALEALGFLETWILKCGDCSEDVLHAIEAVRHDLRAALDEPEDPLEDAAHALMKAEHKLRGYHGRHGEAILHAIVQASVNVRHAQQLKELP